MSKRLLDGQIIALLKNLDINHSKSLMGNYYLRLYIAHICAVGGVVALLLIGDRCFAQAESKIKIQGLSGAEYEIEADRVTYVDTADQNSWGAVAVYLDGGSEKYYTSKINLNLIPQASQNPQSIQESPQTSSSSVAAKAIAVPRRRYFNFNQDAEEKQASEHVDSYYLRAYPYGAPSNFQPADTLLVKHFTYAFSPSGGASYLVPPGNRLKILNIVPNTVNAGQGYYVELVQDEGASLRLTDSEMTPVIDVTGKRFVVYPSAEPGQGSNLDLDHRQEAEDYLNNEVYESSPSQQVSNDQDSGQLVISSPSIHVKQKIIKEETAPTYVEAVAYVNAGVNVRSGPSENYHIVGSLSRGTRIEVVGTDGEWVKIKDPSGFAWVHGAFVEESAPSSPRVTQPDECFEFDPNKYSSENLRAFIKRQQELDNNKEVEKKKREFFNYFSGFARHLSQVSGYPASVMLAQWAGETGWGTSNVLYHTFNFSGKSCFTKNSGFESAKVSFSHSKKSFVVNRNCAHPRRKKEGGYYAGYKNLFEAGYDYVHNLVERPDKARYYPELRKAIKSKKLAGKDLAIAVANGLKAHATDEKYIEKNLDHMNENNLYKYDLAGSCR